jgi:phenylacetaldehyde dehydrogenase
VTEAKTAAFYRDKASHIKIPSQAFIDGGFRPAVSGKVFENVNPATGETFGTVAACDAADVDLAVKAARRAFDAGIWSRAAPETRKQVLLRLADLVRANTEELAVIESIDSGKTIKDCLHEIGNEVPTFFQWYAELIDKSFGKVAPTAEATVALIVKEPIGVVGLVLPWNFPLLMAAWKLAPALAAGCTVVLKVAEQTPLSALRLGELVQEAGFPKGVVNILAGYGETAGAALAAHADVDKVAFTGSTEVGRLIVQAAAGNLKKVSLELGGKSPTIVFADADIDAAIPGAASAIFFNHGQCCCAGSRLYAHKSVFDKVVEGVSAAAQEITVGSGLDPKTQMGPLVSDEQFKRVTGYIASGIKEGAKVVTGGKRAGDNGGYFVQPTVFTNTKPSMKIVQEEIFGPVVCAESFDDTDLERIGRQANDSIYGLAASIWTKDISKAHKLARLIRSGTVWINCHNVFDASLPFGGYKQSGWGREMGGEVLANYTEVKAVTAKL